MKSDLLDSMSPHVLGKVQLKPFCGLPVEADVIRVNISNDIRSVGDNDDVTVLCAVVRDLNDEMILSEGSALRGAAVSWSAMACAGNAIPGHVPQSKNPVFGPGEDSWRLNLSLAWFTVSPCVPGLNRQPSDCYDY